MTPTPRTGPAILALAALFSGATAPASTVTPAIPAEIAFEQHELVLGPARKQTVLAGFLLGGEVADLAVVELGEDGERRLRLYGFGDGSWQPRVEAELRPGVALVDLATIGERQRLITWAGGRVAWFDPDAAEEHQLVDLPTTYKWRDEDGTPRVDISRDLNDDGRDDLVMPDVGGFWIAVQQADGSFAEAVRLGPPEPFLDQMPAAEARRLLQEGTTAQAIPAPLARLHLLDYDGDGRRDLVFWNQDHFDVHLQDEHGHFATLPVPFSVEVPFDSDGVYSRMADFRDAGVMSFLFGCGKTTRRTVLHSFRDFDGDGVADLVTLTLTGASPNRQRSRYAVHFGSAAAGGLRFAREAGATIQPRGKAGAMEPAGYASQWFEDFDGDGQVDVLFRDVRVGVGGMFRALVGNSVPIDLEAYRMEDGTYPDEPAARRRIRRFAPFAGIGNVFLPPVLMGDVNGDGHWDLVLGKSPRQLRLYLGAPGPGLLARRPQKVAVALPPDERNTRLVDLDRDGRQDILIHRGPTEHDPDQPHRVTMLLVR